MFNSILAAGIGAVAVIAGIGVVADMRTRFKRIAHAAQVSLWNAGVLLTDHAALVCDEAVEARPAVELAEASEMVAGSLPGPACVKISP